MKNDNLLNHVVITSTQCYLRTVNKKLIRDDKTQGFVYETSLTKFIIQYNLTTVLEIQHRRRLVSWNST